MSSTMDIHSQHGYPSGALSNFPARSFVFDGVPCGSMEGLLQSLKFEDRAAQASCCALAGLQAKRAGSTRSDAWKAEQKLWWKGTAFGRESARRSDIVASAYAEMAKACPDFAQALMATGEATLTHSIGNPDPKDTVLTEKEFCDALTSLREELTARPKKLPMP